MAPAHENALELPKIPFEDDMRLFLELFTGDDVAEERRGLIDVMSERVSKLMTGRRVPPASYTQVMSTIAAMPKEHRKAYMELTADVVNSVAAKDNSTARFAADGGELTSIFRRKNTTPIYRYMPNSGSESKDVGIKHARKISLEMADEILGRFKVLNRLLGPYEELIRTRWLKETRGRRREILLASWQDMATEHRPDMSFLLERPDMPQSKYQPVFSWPYINQEDLLKPKAMLVFLNSRGRNHPVKFAYSDLELAPLFKERNVSRETKFTASFVGTESPANYAVLTEWASAAEALEAIQSGQSVHVNHSLQILHIQCGIMSLLTNFVLLMLGDKDVMTLPPAVPEPMQLSDQDKAFESMEIIAREAPYRLPSRLDLNRLQTLCNAKKSQAIDHAWALREDPAYFVLTMEQYREHCVEMVLDRDGNTHASASHYPLYSRVVAQMIREAHHSVFVLDHICQRFSKVQDLWSENVKSITAGKELSLELHEEVVKLRFFIEQAVSEDITEVGMDFCGAPGLREHHYRTGNDDPDGRYFHVLLHEHDTNDVGLDRLLRLKGCLCDPQGREVFGTHVLLDEIEHLMQTNARSKSFVSAHLIKRLSRISVYAECLHQLHQFQPWAHKIEADIEDRRIQLEIEWHNLSKTWDKLYKHCKKFEDDKQLYRSCCPLDGKFDYPASERPSRENVNKMRSAETALETFWMVADAHWMRLIRTTPSALVKHIMGERNLVRTQPWAPPAATKTTKRKKKLQALTQQNEAFSEHAHDVTKQVTGSFTKTTLPIRSKTKTKGVTNDEHTDEAIPVPLVVPSPAPRNILKVDKRTLKVFRALFHTPDSPNQPGEVAWPDLLYAMISVGFGAEKLRSSSWQFTPPASIGERSIQLHEPHPVSKLPFVLARHYGRRLRIAYQWTTESFELA